MDYTAGLPGLGRQTVERLLTTLNDLRLKSQDLGSSACPLLALHLHGGATIEGWLLDFGPAQSPEKESVVVIHRAWPTVQQPAEAVAYITIREVQAVTVFEAVDAASHLLPPLTKMELRRIAEQLAQEVLSRLGTTVSVQLATDETPESSFGRVAQQLSALKIGLLRLIVDPIALKEIAGRVKVLSFQTGPADTVKLESNTLQITLRSSSPTSPDVLKQMIEAAL